MTKDEIINTQDGQALADAVAVDVMGFKQKKMVFDWGYPIAYQTENMELFDKNDWQPHQPTEMGKAQAVDLAEKCGLSVNPYMLTAFIVKNEQLVPDKKSWQIAVLKAALLSVKDGK